MFGQGQILSAHSLRLTRSYFVFLDWEHDFTAAKGPAEVKGRERHWDADALWPQPGKSLFSAITQPSHSAGQLLGGKGNLDITREIFSAMHCAPLLLHGA